MSLSTAFNVISSSFAANAAQTGCRLEQYRQRQYAWIFAGACECRDEFLRRSRRRFRHPGGQRRAPRAGLELNLAGGDPAGDLRRIDDARPNRRRQFIDHFDLGRRPERRLALRHAGQSAKRAHNLRGLADLVVRRRRGRVGRLRSHLVPQQRERDGPAGARNGRPEHGLVGQHHQFAAHSVHGRQQRGRHAGYRPAPMFRAPRIRATRS